MSPPLWICGADIVLLPFQESDPSDMSALSSFLIEGSDVRFHATSRFLRSLPNHQTFRFHTRLFTTSDFVHLPDIPCRSDTTSLPIRPQVKICKLVEVASSPGDVSHGTAYYLTTVRTFLPAALQVPSLYRGVGGCATQEGERSLGCCEHGESPQSQLSPGSVVFLLEIRIRV